MTPVRICEDEVKYVADKASRKSGGNQPISRHPLFPAIVALWFGALFGLASIAVKPALVEQVVVAAGIDSLIPMAAPPLGATARILIALAMTGAGVVIGMLVARRIARPQTETRARRRDAASIAADEAPVLSADNFAALPEQPALAIAEAPASAPLAAHDPSILDVAEFEIASFDAIEAPAPAPAEERSPVVSSLFDTYSREITMRAKAFDIEDAPAVQQEDAAPERAGRVAERMEYSPLPAKDEVFERAETNAARRIATADLDALSQVELLERLALAMERRRSEAAAADAAASVPEAPASAEIEPEPQACEPQYEPLSPPAVALPSFAPPPLAPPPLVMPRLNPVAEAAPEFDERAEAATDEAEPESREPAAELPRVPAALRPVGQHFFDADEDEDDALPGYVPPRHISLAPDASARTFDAPAEPDAAIADYEDVSEDEEGDELEEGYSSLLDLSRPAVIRQPFIRIEEPEEDGVIEPVVIFPGEEAPSAASQGRRPFDAPGGDDAEDTERALRAALATLKRMSGAA